MVRQIFALRSRHHSRKWLRLRLDRTRLETLGSVRRGGRIGFIAFPVSNQAELAGGGRYGIESTLILSSGNGGAGENTNGLISIKLAIIEEMAVHTVLVFVRQSGTPGGRPA